MMNKKNKLNNFLVALMLVLVLFLGVYPYKEPPEKINTPLPLFGHFYPKISTNALWLPNLRYGSGIR
jgi:hypothetical protein